MPRAAFDRSDKPADRAWVWLIDLALILLFVLVVFWPMVFSGESVSATPFLTDLLKLTEPSLVYSGERLRHGELPLWNPYWSAGYPHLAMPNSGVFYPTTILFGLLPFAVALNISVLSHVYLAGAFSYLLGRVAIGQRVPALYLAYAAIAGDLVLPDVLTGHLWSIQTLAWFPLAVLFTDRICRGRWFGSALGFAVTIALMIFAGDPQGCFFALSFLASFFIVLLVNEGLAGRVPLSGLLSRSLAFGLATAFGFSLAAIQLIPSRELFAESVRAQGVAYEHFNGFIGSPWDLVKSWFTDAPVVHVSAAGRFTLAFALVGLLFARSIVARTAAIAVVPCVLYAFAPQWLFEHLIQKLPVYGGIRGAARISLMLYWAVTFLSAFGVHAWISVPFAERQRRNRIAIVTLLMLALFSCLPAMLSDALPASRIALTVAGMCAALVALAVKERPRIRLAICAVLIFCAAAELDLKVRAADLFGDTALYAVNSQFKAFSEARTDLDRIEVIGDRDGVPHGSAIGTLTGDRMVWGYHALLLTRYARLVDDVGGMGLAPRDEAGRLQGTNEVSSDWITPQMLPVIDLFNVRYIVHFGGTKIFWHLDLPQVKRFRPIDAGSLAVYENTRALPPIYPIHEAITCATDEEAIALLRGGKIDPRRQVAVPPDFDPAGLAAPARPEPVTIREYKPERIVVDAELSAPAIVVFSEMYYPGWRAYVDSAERKIVCVNTAFRGVRVDEGQHTIEMRYAPRSLRTGAWISAAASATMLLVTMGGLLRSRRNAKRGSETTAA